LAFVSWRPQIRVICGVSQEASAGAARLMAWACTAEGTLNQVNHLLL
jgi:hypothetical protein